MEDGSHLDDLLGAAFGKRRREGESVLESIERISGAKPRVLLRDPPEETTPIIRVREQDGEPAKGGDRRFSMQGEIARGGIGVVYKGRDRDLGRSVALKVLRAEHADNALVIHRFVEEAQIGGQLQHPGVVPVYGLGMQPDGRPYFAMKLVRGETLSALLEDRADPTSDQRKFLGIFEQVADAMAYAHARGVIHRDLKPSNIMIGAFGEVQVVDWGLAKVLGLEEAPLPDVTQVQTVRSGSTGSASMVGSVLGTPGYMPPEQALGHVEQMDERSDVFSLGAILLEILTGKPPYLGDSRDRLIQASQGRLDGALERLDACDADEELKALCRRCLEPVPGDRPRNADVLARGMGDYLSAVEERARAAEVDAAEARAKAVEAREAQARERTRAAAERARRKRTLLAAAAILVAVLAGVGGFAWKLESDRDRERTAATLVDTARREASEARGAGDWTKALAAAKQAVTLADVHDADETTTERARALLTEIETVHAEAMEQARIRAEDDAVLARFEEIRLSRLDHSDYARAREEYAEAFREFGVDVLTLDPEEAAKRLLARTRPVEFAVALDDWVSINLPWVFPFLEEETENRNEPVEPLVAIAKRIDPDPWRNRLRDAIGDLDQPQLRELARTAPIDELPPRTLGLLGVTLFHAGEAEESIRLLAAARRRFPQDFYLNYRLGLQLQGAKPPRLEEAMRYATAAVALRPRSARRWFDLGLYAGRSGDAELQVAAYRRCLELDPGLHHAAWNLAYQLQREGRVEDSSPLLRRSIEACKDPCGRAALTGKLLEAEGRFEEAVSALEEALALKPGHIQFHSQIGFLLQVHLSEHERALEHLTVVAEAHPEDASSQEILGRALLSLKRNLEAVDALEKAVRLDPENVSARFNLGGLALPRLRRYEESVEHLTIGLKLDPDAPPQFTAFLGASLYNAGRWAEAAKAYREYLEKVPDDSQVLWNLGLTEERLENLDAALDCYRRARENDPGQAVRYHAREGTIHFRREESEAAEKSFRAAVTHAPLNPYLRGSLGTVLGRLGRNEEALEHLRFGVETLPDRAEGWTNLAHVLDQLDRIEEAVEAARRAVETDPQDPRCRAQLFKLLVDRLGASEEAEEHLRALSVRTPDDPWVRTGLASLLSFGGQPAEARRILTEILDAEPAYAQAHTALAVAQTFLGDLDAAARSAVRAVALEPENAGCIRTLAVARAYRGEYGEALTLFEKANRLEPVDYALLYSRGWLHANARDPAYRDPAAAMRDARQVAKQQPLRGVSHTLLGLALLRNGKDEAAAAAIERAFELHPEKNPTAAILMALLLARAGKRDEARTWLETAEKWRHQHLPPPVDFSILREELTALLDAKGGGR